ncbi:MAG: hypothetical protein HeimC3_48740 [Candidatus Heimdallarchaeota archaeon LC_3]|nr:MAG: hypothetical protein HeimC3_48740 [Candidatus Heimdallarchaeota archaeon LC_3]
MKLAKITRTYLISILIATFFVNITYVLADGTHDQNTEDHMNGMMGFDILPSYFFIIFLIILGVIILYLIKQKNQGINSVLDIKRQNQDNHENNSNLITYKKGFNEINTSFCQNCGNHVDFDAKFCDNCGTKI